MRVLHVVTLVDDRNSYGGPLTVALGHCAELRRRGHDAVLLAGWRGQGRPPTQLEGTPSRLFPVRSVAPGQRFAGLFSPTMLRWLHANGREFDVAHLHLARDLVPLTAAWVLRRLGVPYVVQTHGMIRPDHRTAARFIDRAWTRPTLRGAATICSLTSTEDADLRAVCGADLHPVRLRNGVRPPTSALPKTVRSADSRPADVLFLARLHPRKRVMDFARAAASLLAEGMAATFSVVGPDDGDLAELRRFIDQASLDPFLRYEGALDHEAAIERLQRADVYVLPSVDEPYPMSILEALAGGTPVVCTTSCGLAGDIEVARAGRVVDPGVPSLTEALRDMLSEPAHLPVMSARALALVTDRFAISDIGDHVVEIYDRAIPGHGPYLDLTDVPLDAGHRYLYVGQLIERKNVGTLIRAFARAGDPSDRLTIVGTGPHESALRGLCAEVGVAPRVCFTGNLDGEALVAAYRAHHTLVLPSEHEVWGLVANEALAVGLHAVVSSRCGAAPSLDGMPGVFVVEPDLEGVSAALTASRDTWTGPMADHPIRRHTPNAYASTVLQAAERALGQP